MWIFTSRGMISAVKHRNTRDTLIIRARTQAHLEAFRGERLRDTSPIEETPDADYRWRCTMSPATFRTCVNAEIAAIDYDNFKDSIPEGEVDYHAACLAAWVAMHDVQAREAADEAAWQAPRSRFRILEAGGEAIRADD